MFSKKNIYIWSEIEVILSMHRINGTKPGKVKFLNPKSSLFSFLLPYGRT